MGDRRTSDILRQYWHATAEAPRDYPGERVDGEGYLRGLRGLHVLGAAYAMRSLGPTRVAPPPRPSVPVAVSRGAPLVAPQQPAAKAAPQQAQAPSKPKQDPAAQAAAIQAVQNARSRAQAAGNHAMAAGASLSRRAPGASARLLWAGRQLLQRATTLKGDVVGQAAMDVTTAAITMVTQQSQATEAVAQLGDVLNAMQPVVVQIVAAAASAPSGVSSPNMDRPGFLMNGQPDFAGLASAGQTIANAITTMIVGFDPSRTDIDPTPLLSQAQSWLSQAQAVLQAPSPPPTPPPASTPPAAVPDPNRPGFLTNGQPDPSYVPPASTAVSSPDPNNPGYLANGQPDPNYVAPPQPAPPAYFDTGSAGGGGGAGDSYPSASYDSSMYDEGGDAEAQAVADFRQSGVDPFADDGGINDAPDPDNPGYLMSGAVDPNYDSSGDSADTVLGQDFYSMLSSLVNKPGDTYTSVPSSTAVNAGAPSAESAARLAAAKKRLAEALAEMAALRAASAQSQVIDEGAPSDDFAVRLAAARQRFAVAGGEALGYSLSSEDVADIVEDAMGDTLHFDRWNREITDALPDPIRARASRHMGAAYLDQQYPPWGSSHGQEGGSVPLTEGKLHVHALGGNMREKPETLMFGDNYCRGLRSVHVLGAALARGKPIPRAGFVQRKMPGGRWYTAIAATQPKSGDHKASIKNARDVASNAIKFADNLKQRVKATKIRGLTQHSVRQVMTASQLLKEADKVRAAGQALAALADRHDHLMAANAAHQKAGAAVAAKQTRLAGADAFDDDNLVAEPDLESAAAVLGAYCESFEIMEIMGYDDREWHNGYASGKQGDASTDGMSDDWNAGWKSGHKFYLQLVNDPTMAEILGLDSPDPSNPGYLMSGAVDPNYASSPAPGAAGPPDYGLGPAPTGTPPLTAGVDYDQDPGPETDQTAYSSDSTKAVGAPLPIGAVIFDGSRSFPDSSIGSFGRFYAGEKNRDGFTYNVGGWWGGGVHHDTGWLAVRGDSMDTVDDVNHTINPDHPDAVAMQTESLKEGWGPLVGNPDMQNKYGKWTYGLRFDAGAPNGGRWFWFRDKAPPWATAADDQARKNQAILDYQTQLTAAKTAYAAAQAQAQLDAASAAALAKQQAADDAAMARQQQQEQAQAEHQAQLQSVADQQAAEAAQQQQQIADDAMARQQMAAVAAQRQQGLAQVDVDAAAAQAAARYEAMAPPDQGVADQEVDQGVDTSADAVPSDETDLTPEAQALSDAGDGGVVMGLYGARKLKAKRQLRQLEEVLGANRHEILGANRHEILGANRHEILGK